MLKQRAIARKKRKKELEIQKRIQEEKKKIEKQQFNEKKQYQIEKFGKEYLCNNLVKLNEEYACPNCNSQYYKISGVLFSINGTYELNCINCDYYDDFGSELTLTIDELHSALVKIDDESLLKEVNDTFHPIQSNEHMEESENYYYSFSDALQEENIPPLLQLLDSGNNHVTCLHKISNKIISVPYKLKDDNKIRILSVKCHFCEDCFRYFDFYNSFIEQIKQFGLTLNDIMIRIDSSKYMNYDSFQDYDTDFYSYFGSESVLHQYGYRVGYSGLSSKRRQKLLKHLNDDKLLSIGQMKSIINLNISRVRGRSGYEQAEEDWRDDIRYLNSLIDSDKNNS